MADGEVCSFEISADCGAIGVEVKDETDATNFDLEILCYNEDTEDVQMGSGEDRPPRDQLF